MVIWTQHLCACARAGRVGFQYEMGALESLAAGADVGPGRSVNIMLDSTAEVRSRPATTLRQGLGAAVACLPFCWERYQLPVCA